MESYRNDELEELLTSYDSEANEIVIVYGQLYLGKSEWIADYCKDRPCLCLAAEEATEREQRYLWARLLVPADERTEDYPSFYDLIASVCEKTEEKLVVWIRDFHLAVKGSTCFFEDMVRLKQSGYRLQILLSSSALGFVENSLIGRIGRSALEIDHFMKIRPLRYEHLCAYQYNSTREENCFCYGILGGYPGLWNYFDSRLSLQENLVTKLLADNGALRDAVHRILNYELRELNVYSTILASLASGMYKLNEIHEHTGFSRAKISVYLKNLMELELVEKVYSVDTAGRDNAQKGIYRICHPLIRFYFAFLYGRTRGLTDARERYLTDVAPDLRRYGEETFQRITAEYFTRKLSDGTLAYPYDRIGLCYGKAGVIPVVTVDRDGNYMVGMCSFEKPVMTYQDYEWLFFLLEQARITPKFIYLIAVRGFDEKILLECKVHGNVRAVTLDEMI